MNKIKNFDLNKFRLFKNKKAYNFIGNVFIWLFFTMVVIIAAIIIANEREKAKDKFIEGVSIHDSKTATLLFLRQPIYINKKLLNSEDDLEITVAELIDLYEAQSSEKKVGEPISTIDSILDNAALNFFNTAYGEGWVLYIYFSQEKLTIPYGADNPAGEWKTMNGDRFWYPNPDVIYAEVMIPSMNGNQIKVEFYPPKDHPYMNVIEK
ncbi:MAG: hypothetical protein ABH828_02705 [archaeon]